MIEPTQIINGSCERKVKAQILNTRTPIRSSQHYQAQWQYT